MAKTIAKIQIEGVIEKENETYNQKWLLETIEKLADNKRNAALVLFIDSPGGGVYESDEVYAAVKTYKEKTKRPVYAYFASLAASGGYYIGCAADKILANRNALTGSIGVIAGHFFDLSRLMERYGVKSEMIHTGRNKTMGNVAEPLTDEQRAIMQSIADECYAQFVGIVAESRQLDAARVTELADGRIYTAQQAKGHGLVDDIAPFDEAVKILKEREFGSRDYKADVKKYAPKQKRNLVKMLKGARSDTTPATALAKILLPAHIPFPAYYYDGGLR